MLVLAVHGSAVPEAGATIERLAESVRGLTGAPVVVGHLDHQAPSLAEVLASCPGAVVVPLLLGDGYHRTVDIPAVARRHDCLVTPGLSGVPAVGLALHDRLMEAGGPGTRWWWRGPGRRARAATAVRRRRRGCSHDGWGCRR